MSHLGAKLSHASAAGTRFDHDMVLAFELVDLGAFVGMGLSVLVVGAVVLGLGLWLRTRGHAQTRGEYRGL